MKFIIVISLFLFGLSAHSQDRKSILPIAQYKANDGYKIVMVSANWCGVCNSNKRQIEKSDSIKSLIEDGISFYEILDSHSAPINFNDHTYNFIPTGQSTGQHQFVDFLLDSPTQITYPSFVVLNENNDVLVVLEGFTEEKEWIALIQNLIY